MFGRVYHTGTRGMFGGRTEVAEVSGTGIEFVPNLTGVFGRVLRPYPTLSKTPGRVFTEQIPPVNCGTYPTKRALVTMLYRIIPHNTQEKTQPQPRTIFQADFLDNRQEYNRRSDALTAR